MRETAMTKKIQGRIASDPQSASWTLDATSVQYTIHKKLPDGWEENERITIDFEPNDPSDPNCVDGEWLESTRYSKLDAETTDTTHKVSGIIGDGPYQDEWAMSNCTVASFAEVRSEATVTMVNSLPELSSGEQPWTTGECITLDSLKVGNPSDETYEWKPSARYNGMAIPDVARETREIRGRIAGNPHSLDWTLDASDDPEFPGVYTTHNELPVEWREGEFITIEFLPDDASDPNCKDGNWVKHVRYWGLHAETTEGNEVQSGTIASHPYTANWKLNDVSRGLVTIISPLPTLPTGEEVWEIDDYITLDCLQVGDVSDNKFEWKPSARYNMMQTQPIRDHK